MIKHLLSSLHVIARPEGQAPARSRENQQRFQATFDDAPLGIAMADFDGHLREVNDHFCRMLGYEPNELIGRSIFDLTHPDDRERTLQIITVAAEEGVRSYRKRFLGKDGRIVWARSTVTPIERQDGTYVLGMIEDITELVAMETALRRRNAQQEAIAELSQRALRQESIESLFDSACIATARTLEAEVTEILEKLPDGQHVLSAGFGWPQVRVGTVFTADDTCCIHLATRARGAVVTDAKACDVRIQSPGCSQDGHVNSSVAVPITSGDGLDYGILAAHSNRIDAFTVEDVNFLRTVANVLGQTLDRRGADEELARRNEQQIATAEFARRALSSPLSDMLEDACQLVRELLGVEFTSYLEVSEETGEFRRVAGSSPLPDDEIIPATARSHAGRAMISNQTVTIDDYACAEDLATGERFLGFGLHSGIASPVRDEKRTFGVLFAQSIRPGQFSAADTRFVDAVSNALAEALARHAAQRALVESEERYRTVVEGASEIIYTLDPEGRFVSVNSAFGRSAGWSAEVMIGKHFTTIVDPADTDSANAAFFRVAAGEAITDLAISILTVDGGRVLFETSASGVFKNGKLTAIHGFSRDVTLRRQLETELEQANRINSLGRLAATIAHEFNNVLMGILPFVELLRRDNPEKRQKAIEHITSSVRRGKRVTEEILRFARPLPPSRTRVSAASVIEAIRIEMESLLGPAYTIELGEIANADLDADPSQLHQALSNLILNSRDAMPDGGTIRLEARMEPPGSRFRFGVVSNPEASLHLIVTDNGCGIPADAINHIFDPLFTTKRNGHGLGLPVTHQVVKKHGGEVFVESIVGEGTVFHLFLPLSPKSEASALPEEVPRTAPVPIPLSRILLVEDDVSVAAGLADLLSCKGVKVDVVSTGGEVAAALERCCPDALVLDIGLPDIDGAQVYAGVADIYPDLPVVFSTGHGDQGKLEPFLKRANVAMLLKPYDSETLLEALARVREKRVN